MRWMLLTVFSAAFLAAQPATPAAGPLFPAAGAAVVWAAETPEWRKEYDDVCGRTAESEQMSEDELVTLIDRCAKLRPYVEKLEATERKIMLRRLQLCCDLYRFVLESKRARR
jgi:hypothetical protein